MDQHEQDVLDALVAMGLSRTWHVAQAIGSAKCGDSVRVSLHALEEKKLVEIAHKQGEKLPSGRIAQSHYWRATEDGQLLATRF